MFRLLCLRFVSVFCVFFLRSVSVYCCCVLFLLLSVFCSSILFLRHVSVLLLLFVFVSAFVFVIVSSGRSYSHVADEKNTTKINVHSGRF